MKGLEIIPAILPADYAEIVDKISLIKGLVKTVQIDICDGHFVPSFTWPYKKHDDSFELLIHEADGLPEWEKLDYEFDLMVDDPQEVVEDWIAVGGQRLIIHAESKGDLHKTLESLQGRVEVGLALNVTTPLTVVDEYRELIGSVQLMGIEKIGFQGQSFDKRVIDRVRDLRAKYVDLPISVDGAVSLTTAPDLIKAGANRLVVGSAIFSAENPGDIIAKLRAL